MRDENRNEELSAPISPSRAAPESSFGAGKRFEIKFFTPDRYFRGGKIMFPLVLIARIVSTTESFDIEGETLIKP